MTSDQRRIVLFLIACLAARCGLVLLARFGSPRILTYLGVFALLVSIGLMYQYFVNPKKPGAFGGQPWWNDLRPVHSLLYLTFAIFVLVLKKPEKAYLILLADVLIGFSAFIVHYKSNFLQH